MAYEYLSASTRSLIDELELTLPVDLTNIASEWNGDESGELEDRAEAALEAQQHWEALLELVENL
jgi:hypothetical protein